MWLLKPQNITDIKNYLQERGLTLDALKAELLDHLLCDVEMQMQNGLDFTTAWESVKKRIPENHFKHIEIETMELLKKKSNITRVFTGISIGLLAIASLFKVMHFPGAAVILVVFIIFTSGILFFGSIRNAYVYRKENGGYLVLLTAILLITFIAFWGFKILQYPGADFLNRVSVISLAISFPAISVYFYYFRRNLKDHLLIKMIRTNQGLFENALLILSAFGIIFTYTALLYGEATFVGEIFFILVVIAAGLYVYTLSWLHYTGEKKWHSKSNLSLLIFSSLALIIFLLPVLGRDISADIRNFSASGAYIIFVIITLVHYLHYSKTKNKTTLVGLISILLIYGVFRSGINAEWFTGSIGTLTSNAMFNIITILFLGALLIAFRKERLFKLLIVITIASHMIQISQG